MAAQGLHEGVGQFLDLACRQLRALGDMEGVKGEQVGARDQGLFQFWQDVGEGPGIEGRQDSQQVAHWEWTASIFCCAAAMSRVR